jgi:sulfur carrier protein ThiS
VRVEVRLYATFAAFAPSGQAGAPFDLDVAAATSVSDIIRTLGIAEQDVHLAIVNGRPVHDWSLHLGEADRIGLFPPVGGG